MSKLSNQVREVSFSNLVFSLLATRDIHKLVERLEHRYHTTNFSIPVPCSSKKIFIFQDKTWVSKVLKKQTRLPFVNQNFDISHGHKYSINAVNTIDPLWADLHNGLASIFAKKRIAPLLEKNRHVLFGNGEFIINDILEEFFLRIWSEYCFGPVDFSQFKTLRAKLVETLIKVFHGNPVNRLPWVGRLTSLRNYHKYLRELEDVDAGLAELLQSAISNKQGIFYELYELLRPKYDNAFQIALDNSFLGILVYDFIYIVLLDATVKIAKNPETNRFLQVQKSMHDGFLYPFRFRTAEESFDGVSEGDYCIINLQRAGLYFSSGPRYCPGQPVFREVYTKYLEMLEHYDLRLVDPDEKIVYNGSRDIPLMQSRHHARLAKRASS